MNNYIFPFLWMRGESEDILRREISKIDDCGIRALCVEARPHDDFCGPGWWHDMDIVLDEARKRDMRVWILDDKHFPTGYANGLIEKQYPERKKRYIACSTADVFGSSRPLSLHVQRMLKPSIGFWEIGNPRNYAEQANNRLLRLVALRFAEGERFFEDAVDLTDCVRDGWAHFTLPEGQWRVHAIYHTRTDGGNETYINMIDAVSAHTQIEGVYEAHYARYGAEFGGTIAGFFSDEPQFGNIFDQCFDTKLGKPRMPLPWSDELETLLAARCGEGWETLLPFLFAESVEKRAMPQIRFTYMDCVSRLYAKNFARPIGEWCRAHGVAYIGHVVEDNGVHSRLGLGAAHWFRAMEGQDMAGIDVIGGQYYFGAPAQTRKAMTPCDGEFFHYALGKLGASGGHLDPKKKGRTMCELFGAYGWSFGVREMKHLLDHLLTRGVNHLVPHAFSMAEYPDMDCPPHFYARGHNPEFPFFAELMKYANRMCDWLNGGTHVASVAVLYDGELDWPGACMPMQKVCRVLTENQIEYDIVCLDMLRDLETYRGSIEGGRLELNGVSFDALLVPCAEYVPQGLLDFVLVSKGFPVCFLDARPAAVLRDASGTEPDEATLSEIPVISLDKLAGTLTEWGMRRFSLEPAFAPMAVYHYRKDARQLFLLMNESPDRRYVGVLRIPSTKPLVWYDGLADRYTEAQSIPDEIGCRVSVELEPGECALLLESEGLEAEGVYRVPRRAIAACPETRDLSAGWNVLCLSPEGETVAERFAEGALEPVSDTLPQFSGRVRYERELELPEQPAQAWFQAEQVFDVMRVEVNGVCAGTRLTPPWSMELSRFLHPGVNKIAVEVAATPARDQLNYPQAPFDFTYEAVEPTGMFGKVALYWKR